MIDYETRFNLRRGQSEVLPQINYLADLVIYAREFPELAVPKPKDNLISLPDFRAEGSNQELGQYVEISLRDAKSRWPGVIIETDDLPSDEYFWRGSRVVHRDEFRFVANPFLRHQYQLGGIIESHGVYGSAGNYQKIETEPPRRKFFPRDSDLPDGALKLKQHPGSRQFATTDCDRLIGKVRSLPYLQVRQEPALRRAE